ncbi:MAG: peroxiredoxin [Chitinivibrionales bacterium]|nr:peroxiredoxin [Chitinivibrionales bacterium]
MKTLPTLFTFITALFLLVSCIHFSALAQEDKTMLKIGDTAPDFSLNGSDGKLYSLSEFKDKKNVVLVFYPGDNTPVCTSQLCALRDDASVFQKKDAVIFGINPGNLQSHEKFAQKNNFSFPLLVDSGAIVAKAYGCAGWPMIQRTVYAVDKSGKIIFAVRGKPDNATIANAIP